MSKVFIKRKRLNENITITDPTLAQQYLAVKKQMVDKKTKKDQLVRNVNQIDSELNILEKNLIAIETRSAQQTGKVNVQQPESEEETIETSESLDEKLSDILVPKSSDELPTFEEYREKVISSIDDQFNDGETLVYEYEGILTRCFERHQSPKHCAELIIEDHLCDLGYNIVGDYSEIEELDDSYIGGDTMGKLAANQSMPIRVVQESIQYKKGMCIEVNGREIINISKVEEYPKFNLIYYKDEINDEKIVNSNWLNQQDVEILSKPEKYRSPSQLERIHDTLRDQISELEDELQYVDQEKRDVEIDMEEELADYDESTHIPEENPRYSLDNKEKVYPVPPHDVYGEKLNAIDIKKEEIESKLIKLYQHPDCPYHHSRYSEAYSSITPEEFNNNLDVKESVINESIYEDIIDDLESEKEKLNKIQDFIIQTTQNIEIDIKTDKIEEPISQEEQPEVLTPIEKEPSIEEPIKSPAFDLVHYEKEPSNIPEESPFELTPDEVLTNETLKTEDGKEPYIPELVEAEDVETELELMNYEDEDESQDEYVFHVCIDEETDHEIIAKVYRDDEDDFWTIRVVKGDEEPLQSMEFDPRLNKLEIIGHLADIYEDIEIIDKKEYEYLLDDKEKIDKEYYTDLIEGEKVKKVKKVLKNIYTELNPIEKVKKMKKHHKELEHEVEELRKEVKTRKQELAWKSNGSGK